MAHFAGVKYTDNKVLRIVVISNDDVNDVTCLELTGVLHAPIIPPFIE